jgi:hypothetical protein
MRAKSQDSKVRAELVLKDIRRATRKCLDDFRIDRSRSQQGRPDAGSEGVGRTTRHPPR